MAVTKVCCTCLSFDVKMVSLADDEIRKCLENVANMRIELEDEFMQNVCVECVSAMKKFAKFKRVCLEANQRLKRIRTQSEIVTEDLLKIEKNKLYSDTTLQFDDNPETRHQVFIEMEKDSFGNESNITPEQPSENESILKNILSGNVAKQESFSEKPFKYKIEIDNVFSMNSDWSKSNVIEDETLETCENDEETKVSTETRSASNKNEDELLGISKDKREVIKSIVHMKKNEILPKKKATLRKLSYATKIILTEQQEVEDFLLKKSSDKYLKAAFKCSFCFIGFMSVEKMDSHMELHDESRGALQCHVCKLRYGNVRRLREHQLTHKIRYKCLTCGGVTRSQKQAVTHQKRHLGVIYECKICSEKFPYDLTFKNHVRTVHATEHVCDLCGDYFTTQADLKVHKKTCQKAKKMRLDCERCDVHFSKLKPWYDHTVGHAKEDDKNPPPADCQICGHKTPTWSHWRYHVCNEHRQRHRDPDKPVDKRPPKTLVCHVCGKKFKSSTGLAHHINGKHSDMKTRVAVPRRIKWTHTCEICNKEFQRNNIKRHMLIHTGEKPFECNLCGKTFTQSNTRDAHVRKMHTNSNRPRKKREIKPREPTEMKSKPKSNFPCEQCHKEFKSKFSLKSHERTHTGEKPFECDVCQRKFSQKNYLYLHSITHTGVKPYACDICQMRFTQKSSLNTHQVVHTGVKNYTCDLCGTTFTQSGSLYLHVKTVHLKIPGRPRNRKRKNQD